MSELKLISPLLDGMEVDSCLESAGGTSVYALHSTRNGRAYVLKHISIPESQTQVDALLFTGAAEDEAAALHYYEQVVNDYKAELDDLEMLRSSANFATYLDYQVVQKEEGVGFELYLLSERWPTLVEYLSENAMTHLRALNLGLDLCTALCDLRTHGLIHRDIKPENIYLNGLNGFMLGDLGVARIDNLKYSTMPERMVTEYTAPEMTDILNPLNTTMDIYSIGMVLYRILNGNHGPFEDEKTSPKAANRMRISGEPLPAPLYSDYELTDIILKACAFRPEDRFQTPDDMMQELVLYMKRNTVTDSLIVPPIITDDEDTLPPELLEEEVEPVRFADVEELDDRFVQSFAPDTESRGGVEDLLADPPPEPAGPPAFAAPRSSAMVPEDEPAPAPPPEPGKRGGKPKRKRRIWIPIVAVLLVLAAGAAAFYFLVLGGAAVHVTSIEAVGRGPDFLIVDVEAGKAGTDLIVRCTDTYGNVQERPYTGGNLTFSDLASGTQYTISVYSSSDRRLTGTTSAMFSTVATTEIVSFTAASQATGQAQLTLVISGPSPAEWTVRYWADGVDPQERTFTGNSVTITGLENGLQYTFQLLPTEDIELSGNTTLEFSTGPAIEITDLQAASLSADTIQVTWTHGENAPEQWTVTCTGTDGTILTETVTETQAQFTGLTTGETYTVTVTATGVVAPATTTVTPTAATVSALAAEVQDDGSLLVTWTTDAADGAWQLLYNVEGAGVTIGGTQQVTGTEATLTGLIPGETYTIELRTAAGERLGGSASTQVSIPAGGDFASYGVTRFFLGLFVRPTTENWTANDLTTMDEPVFTSGQTMVFALESLTGRSSSDDAVELVYVVKNATGAPVSTGSLASTWDGLWDGNLILGEVADMPQEAGTYTLQIYLNGQLAASREFTIQ